MIEQGFRVALRGFINNSMEILRVLSYDESGEIAVKENEYYSLIEIMDENRCIGVSAGIMESANIYIIDGFFAGPKAR